VSSGAFVLELLCEEIPANALPWMREQLLAGFRGELAAAGFEGFTVSTFSTVRRVVVYVEGLPAQQPDREEEVLGPPARAAFSSDGSPAPAGVGFAKAQGVSVDSLRVVQGPKGEVVAATRQLPGKPTPGVLGEISERVIPALRVPKTMRWGNGEHTFVRPVHKIVALFGEGRLREKVPVSLFGVHANSGTVGHRMVSPARIEIKGVKGLKDYADLLSAAGVVLDPAARREMLESAASTLAAEVQCEVREDPQLVAELAELVEFPGLLRGEIGASYLDLPEEVLVTTLRHHQKCMVLSRDGALAPFFLALRDRPDDPEGHVRRGNEWVAGARLADAAFFFTHDRKTPFAARREALQKVVVHQKLGTFLEKAAVVERLASWLSAAAGLELSPESIAKACSLLKLDLTTSMVGEFPELQGVMGGIYARLDGEPEEIWQAIADQYVPVGLDGPLPRGPLAAVVGVADRLDTIAGLFAAGGIPSGSKDPFALRRAALAVVRIAAEAPLRCDLADAARQAIALRKETAEGEEASPATALLAFLEERVRYYLTAVTGVRPEVADAVLDAHWGVVPGDVARARALEAVREEDVFASLAVAFKRVRNMVAKNGPGRFSPQLLKERAEKELVAAVAKTEKEVAEALGRGDHVAGLHALAGVAEPLDRFFTDVLVICEDEALRAARLGLLARVEKVFLVLADVSRLSAS
jgi:glycyl-tRNA synthetase beta chain